MIDQNQTDEIQGPRLRRAMALVTLAWIFGSVWATATAGAPLTDFALGLGTTNLQFGILSALPFIASLAALPASVLTERLGTRRWIFLISLYTQRLLWIPIALVPVWVLHRFSAPAATNVFLLLMFIMYAAGNAGTPAWVSWMADIVPTRLRGKYFSVRRQIGLLSGIPAAVIVGSFMDHHGKSATPVMLIGICSLIFLCSAPFGIADIHMFHYVPEPRRAKKKTHWMTSLISPLRNPQFLYFGAFVATLTFAVSFMGQFVTLYLQEQIHASNTGIQLITLVAPMVAQLALLGVWGAAADRMGKKPVLAIASAALAPVGLGWCFMNEHRIWLGYVLSALGGGLWCGIEVANFNLVLEMSAKSDGQNEQGGDSGFVAINAVIINVAGCLGGLASGVIAQTFSAMHWRPFPGWKAFTFFDILFILSGVLRLLAAIVFLPLIKEPTAKPTHQTLRFMTGNIYNNLFQAVLLPLRMAGFAQEERPSDLKK